MEDIKKIFIKIMYSILGIIVGLLIVRFIIDQVSLNESHPIIDFFRSITNAFVAPFKEIIPERFNFPINTEAGFAGFIYVIWGSIFIVFVSSFMQDDRYEIVKDSVDSAFKFLESILLLRITFDLLSFNPETRFVELITNLSSWTDGIIENRIVGEDLNLSAIVALIIVIIFDVVSETLIQRTLKPEKKD